MNHRTISNLNFLMIASWDPQRSLSLIKYDLKIPPLRIKFVMLENITINTFFLSLLELDG